MHNLYVSDVIRLGKGKLICGLLDLVLGDFCSDSRVVKEGDVYVGIRGENFDGNSFYKDALSKGASVCILDKLDGYDEDICLGKTVVLVEDTVVCLQELARYKRSLYDIPVIAITGSVGKTSTKDMVYSVVSKKYKTHKTYENLNNYLGVPFTILGLRDHGALVVEMGMNSFGEISLVTGIAKPTVAIITNIGTAHIGILGSRENILKAKLEILEGLIGNVIILNNDNDLLNAQVACLKDKYKVLTVGINNESDYQAVNIRSGVFESTFDILGIDKDISPKIGGEAFIYNALVGYAVGVELGIESDLIKEGISAMVLSSHRLVRSVNSRGVMVIDDTYNASFDSVKASLELLGKVDGGRKIAILGDMLELGDYAVSLHEQLGECVIKNEIDILVTVGEYSRLIGSKAIEMGMEEDKVISFAYEDNSYEYLDSLLEKDDVVLVKGSHGIHLVNVVNKIMEFE